MTFKQPLPKAKVLGIGSSPRKNGNSDFILEEILEGVKEENIPYEKVQLRDLNFQSCIGCEGCRKKKACTLKDDMQKVYPSIIDSEAMIWISPAHTYNVTALMKAFIDRMYTFYNFTDERPRGWNSQLSKQNRKAVIVGIGEQVDEEDMGFTIESMRLTLKSHGYEIVDELAIFGIFDRGGVKQNKEVIAKAKEIGKKLAKSLKI